MILRRIAEGIRQQDWFVVIVEIMIVVVGIFIGLQVDDWNDRRKERASEAVYLLSIKQDLQASVTMLEEHQEVLLSRLSSLVQLANDEIADIPVEDFSNLMNSGLFSLRFLQVQRNTYSTLESAGQIALLRSVELQRALFDFSQALEMDPDYAKAYYNRSLIYKELGEHKSALKDTLKAQALGYSADGL